MRLAVKIFLCLVGCWVLVAVVFVGIPELRGLLERRKQRDQPEFHPISSVRIILPPPHGEVYDWAVEEAASRLADETETWLGGRRA
jgi:hypothetical protein